MGKSGKKQKQQQQQQRRTRRGFFFNSEPDEESAVTVASEVEEHDGDDEDDEEEEDGDGVDGGDDDDNGGNDEKKWKDCPSKFQLYQQSVQSPKGDISYLQKFFLMYIGGRTPLHLQEDFCGTALLSAEWLHSDPRRTAVGVDLDLEALTWCLENNINKSGGDGFSRISLFHGNVLQPMEAKLVNQSLQDLMQNVKVSPSEGCCYEFSADEEMRNCSLPARDIVCAFNYSCCCLHTRKDLLLYFKHVHNTLSCKGGIFVMDVYGGTSSEHELRLQRRFPSFTYIWEQAEFDVVNRSTRISLHFNLQKQQRKLRHAFSYHWRLWSLPEIKDCLEEAGFKSIHFWIRQMPDTMEVRNSIGFGKGRDVKYEEVSTFKQQDAWNAYVVGVAK